MTDFSIPQLVYEEGSFGVFLLVSVALGGGAAALAGRAIAQTWRPWWQVVAYMLILGGVVRFFHYALFAGTLLSLHYYLVDYDLRAEAAGIDTQKVAVHILSGEYDASGTMELGQAAHAAIPGSTWTGMEDVGHFPMSENPEAFLAYLKPVLESLKSPPAD